MNKYMNCFPLKSCAENNSFLCLLTLIIYLLVYSFVLIAGNVAITEQSGEFDTAELNLVDSRTRGGVEHTTRKLSGGW